MIESLECVLCSKLVKKVVNKHFAHFERRKN